MPTFPWFPAALPFLPLGRGALTLIFGGLFVVTLALFWALVTPMPSLASLPAERTERPEPRPPIHNAGRAPRLVAHAVPSPLAPGAPAGQRALVPRPPPPLRPKDLRIEAWAADLARVSHARGFGALRLTPARGGRVLARFLTCTSRSARSPTGCALEREFLESAARLRGRPTRATEVACSERDGCTFDLDVGGWT